MQPAHRHEPSASAGELLRLVCETWARALDIESVGPDDDFFELGGHSLLLLDIVDSLEADTGVQVQLEAFFDDPTPRGIVASMARAA